MSTTIYIYIEQSTYLNCVRIPRSSPNSVAFVSGGGGEQKVGIGYGFPIVGRERMFQHQCYKNAT
ncbi:hypothetical protein CsSME_00036347 [Camellia sinensis var. sinensis]